MATDNPPITARPSGAFCSPPSPRPSDIGNIPMIMASAVMSTGRSRVAHGDRVTGWQLGSELGRDLLDGGGDAAEVAVLHVGVDVEDRLDVRVADDGRHLVPLERGEIAEELLLAGPARGDRRIHERV